MLLPVSPTKATVLPATAPSRSSTGEEVGEHLHRVPAVGQPVDHRHAGVPGELRAGARRRRCAPSPRRSSARRRARCPTRARRAPIWLSAIGRVMAWPPSCSIAASKESRVRVEAFSKISTSVRPARVLTTRRWARASFSVAARWKSAAVLVVGQVRQHQEIALHSWRLLQRLEQRREPWVHVAASARSRLAPAPTSCCNCASTAAGAGAAVALLARHRRAGSSVARAPRRRSARRSPSPARPWPCASGRPCSWQRAPALPTAWYALRNGTPCFTSASARSVAWVEPSSSARPAPLAVEAHRGSASRKHRQRADSSGAGLQQRAAILLQVAVVAAGQALHRGEQAGEVADRAGRSCRASARTRRGCASAASSTSRRRCRRSSGQKPNSWVEKSIRSVRQPARVQQRQPRGGVEVVEREVAIAHRVEAVDASPRRTPSSGASCSRSMGSEVPRDGAHPQRQHVGLLQREGEGLRVAQEAVPTRSTSRPAETGCARCRWVYAGSSTSLVGPGALDQLLGRAPPARRRWRRTARARAGAGRWRPGRCASARCGAAPRGRRRCVRSSSASTAMCTSSSSGSVSRPAFASSQRRHEAARIARATSAGTRRRSAEASSRGRGCRAGPPRAAAGRARASW